MNIFIVDMIEGFARIGALSSPRVAALIPKQVAFLEQIPQESIVVLACDSHEPDDFEFKRLPKHCEKGTEESKICPELLEVIRRRGLRHSIVRKTTHSAFFRTGFEFHPDFLYTSNWVMFGCVTDICITANVMEMDYRGRTTTLVRDLIDTYDLPGHDPKTFNTLWFENYLPIVWGAKITTADEILRNVPAT